MTSKQKPEKKSPRPAAATGAGCSSLLAPDGNNGTPITFDTHFLNYEEWRLRNPDAEEQEENCDDCDGTGVSECFHCGHETECETCDGSGVVNSAREQYERQLQHDKQVLRKYADWLTRAAQQRTGADGAVAEESPNNLRTKDNDAGTMGDAG